jgi:hypothetical protein
LLSPPSEEEVNVAQLHDLKQRLQCRDPFLNTFLQLLLKDHQISAAWLTPLPRSDTGMGLCLPASPLAQRGVVHPPLVWIRPIDDIWRVAAQAGRDRHITHHERELAFVITLVKPLMEDNPFRFNLKPQDLNIAACIQRARRACSDRSDDPASEGSEETLLAQASLLKSLLVPESIDWEADRINPVQHLRIGRAVEQALGALELIWDEPEAVKPLGRTRLRPLRDPKGGSGYAH